jgi:hypothetical protein
LSEIHFTPKLQEKPTDRSYSLGNACGADGFRKTQRVRGRGIEGKKLAAEPEVASERSQSVVRIGAGEEGGCTLERLHSSSVAGPAISAYIV